VALRLRGSGTHVWVSMSTITDCRIVEEFLAGVPLSTFASIPSLPLRI
jgi:hypothetical protein